MIKYLLLLLFLPLFINAQEASLRSLNQLESFESLESYFISKYVGDNEIIKRSLVKTKLGASKDYFDYQEISLCAGDVFPFKKGQDDKSYHFRLEVVIDQRKISGDSPFCEVSQRRKVFQKSCKRKDDVDACMMKGPRCFKAKTFYGVILSDTYQDSCGNKVRGFAEVTYTIPGEDVMNQVSPGHLLQIDEVFSGGVVNYTLLDPVSVSQKRFLFFSPED